MQMLHYNTCNILNYDRYDRLKKVCHLLGYVFQFFGRLEST